MEINIASIYGYLLIILGLILALYYQLESITKNLSDAKDVISSIKYGQYAWFSFFSLTLMGTLVHFLGIFQIVQYRNWGWDYSNNIVPNCRNINNKLTVILDVGFILFCFVRLLISIRKVEMERGKIFVSLHHKWELVIFIAGHHVFALLFSLFLAVVGVSYVLIGLYFCVITPLSWFVIKKYSETN